MVEVTLGQIPLPDGGNKVGVKVETNFTTRKILVIIVKYLVYLRFTIDNAGEKYAELLITTIK